jgi:hypothetical protein
VELPQIPHLATDPKRNIRVTLMAYRQLSEDEVRRLVRYLTRFHRLKRNRSYTFPVPIDEGDVVP